MIIVYVAVIVSIALAAAAYLWARAVQFRNTPQYRWRERVAAHLEELHRRDRELSRPDPEEAKLAGMADDLFRRQLGGTPVAVLDAFPGIGPATVERLRAAGLKTLADAD